jgi:hypothetical protein
VELYLKLTKVGIIYIKWLAIDVFRGLAMGLEAKHKKYSYSEIPDILRRSSINIQGGTFEHNS